MPYQDSGVTVLTVDELLKRDSGMVSPAHAPDGLPLITTVNSPPIAESLLWSAARALGMEGSLDDFSGTPLGPVAAELGAALRAQRTQRLTVPDGQQVEALILGRPLGTLVGRTLMERLISPSYKTISGVSADTRAAMPPPPGSPTTFDAEPMPLPKFDVGETCLALPIDGSAAIVSTRRRTANGWPEYAGKRRFVEERMDSVRESEIEFSLSYRKERLAAGDHAKYHALLAQSPSQGEWIVPRNAAARTLIGLAGDLALRHEQGEVHGDLKPANILLTADGAMAIDSLGLRDQERSVAMTRGWAAPEQILGLPVCPQTDLYAFGMLLLEFVNGVLYGEEAQITIPVGGRLLERHTLLRNPGVFIDPDTAPIARGAVEVWRELIERCVRFEPSERLASMREAAAILDSVTASGSLTGEYRVPLSFGSRVTAGRVGGETGPAWLA